MLDFIGGNSRTFFRHPQVYNGQERLQEALKHGYSRVIAPAANAPKRVIKGLEVIKLKRLPDILDIL